MSKNNLPPYIIAPGRTIEDEIQYRNWKQKDVADRLGISQKHLIDLIQGEVSLTYEMAVKLEYIFGTSAKFWMNLEQNYQLEISKHQRKELALQEEQAFKLIKPFLKIPEQLKLLSLKNTSLAEWISEVKKFFCRATSLTQSIQIQKASVFRKSKVYEIKPEGVAVLSRTSEILAEQQRVWVFQKSGIKNLITELKPLLTKATLYHDKIQDICNRYGIYYIFTPNFPKLPVSALSRYYLQNPLIHITDKGNRLDIFWFNFFHELWHIYAEHISKTVANLEIDDNKSYVNSPEEVYANLFAGKALVPDEIYEKVKKDRRNINVEQQAKNAGVHVSLLYGRLCRDGILPPQAVSRYMVKINE